MPEKEADPTMHISTIVADLKQQVNAIFPETTPEIRERLQTALDLIEHALKNFTGTPEEFRTILAMVSQLKPDQRKHMLAQINAETTYH